MPSSKSEVNGTSSGGLPGNRHEAFVNTIPSLSLGTWGAQGFYSWKATRWRNGWSKGRCR